MTYLLNFENYDLHVKFEIYDPYTHTLKSENYDLHVKI